MHSLELVTMQGKNVYKLHLEGFIELEEMQALRRQAEQMLQKPAPKFRVFSDVRGFVPATADVQEVMKEIQSLFQHNGMQKVAILVDNVVTKMQLQRLHKKTSVAGLDQFFSADEENYEQAIGRFLGSD